MQPYQHLKPYAELPCPDIDSIQKEVISWIKNNTEYLTDQENPHLDIVVDTVDLIKKCTSVVKFCKDVCVPIKEVQLTIIPKRRDIHTPLPLHVNEVGQNFKINIPILNTDKRFITEWYDVPVEDLNGYPKFRREYWREWEPPMVDLRELDPVVQDKYPLAASYSMVNTPIVFNACYPHRVVHDNYASAVFPRVLLSIIPFKDESLIKYLKK